MSTGSFAASLVCLLSSRDSATAFCACLCHCSFFFLRFCFVIFLASCVWLTMRGFRSVRKGFSVAFALSTDTSQILRNMNGFRTVHSAIYLLFVTRSGWNASETRSSG